jgi:hypothetical protein
VWARAGDANSNAEVTSGIIIPVAEGTNNGDKLFMLTTNNPIVLDTTSLAFSTYGASSGEIGVGGAGLTKSGSGTVTYDVGQGLGIIVATDSVGIDTAVVTRVKRGTIGAGGSATVTINHALALTTNQHVAEVAIIERSTGDRIWCSWTTTDGNNVSVTLPGAPSANQYDWTVVG